jgi:hypothetical protein
MKVQNQEGQTLIQIYKNEVYRQVKGRGQANLGRTFSPVEIKSIKKFAANSDHYVTWPEWQRFLKTLQPTVVDPYAGLD